jgi:hypothetical protein
MMANAKNKRKTKDEPAKKTRKTVKFDIPESPFTLRPRPTPRPRYSDTSLSSPSSIVVIENGPLPTHEEVDMESMTKDILTQARKSTKASKEVGKAAKSTGKAHGKRNAHDEEYEIEEELENISTGESQMEEFDSSPIVPKKASKSEFASSHRFPSITSFNRIQA